MKLNYIPESPLEKFGDRIYKLLVENFPQTYYVGGMVRDLLLKRPVTDIDIATSARPDKMVKLFSRNGITFDQRGEKFGTITAKKGNRSIEVTTLRKDTYAGNRYPKVTFVKSAKTDSLRRDFSINSLYLSQKTGKILDFHKGLPDLESRTLRFIGQPDKRIQEDPLRIIRALRFSLVLGLKIESKTFIAIKKSFYEIGSLTQAKINNEIEKIKDARKKLILIQVLQTKNLDILTKKL